MIEGLLDVPYDHCGVAWGRGFGRVRVTVRSRGRTLYALEIHRIYGGFDVEAVRVVYPADLARLRSVVRAIRDAAPVGEDGAPWLEVLRLRIGDGCECGRVELAA